MADEETDDNKLLNFTLVHGSKKYPVSLGKTDEDTEPRVANLARVAEQLTQVPQNAQKLIFKGKSLSDKTQCLSSLGIKDRSKIMLIGKKYDPEEDENVKKIRSIERQADDIETKLGKLTEELDGISKGFLKEDLIPESLEKLRKQIKGVAEELMKNLEALDSLTLDADSVVKSKRKTVIKRIQAIIDSADGASNTCDKIQENGKL